MKVSRCHIVAFSLFVISTACNSRSEAVRDDPSTPTQTGEETVRTWPSDPSEYSNYEPLKAAWKNFEQSQNYRLARPSDRNLTPRAAARIKYNPNQIEPFLTWWGATNYGEAKTTNFLLAIVVDPSRSDPKRYGAVVISAVASEGPRYKPYWVAREQDMESCLICLASDSVYVECFRPDGTVHRKDLVWDKKSRQFRLE